MQIVNKLHVTVNEPGQCSQDSDLLQDGPSGVRIPEGQGIYLFFRNGPEWPWGPPGFLFGGYRDYFPGARRPGSKVYCSSPYSEEGKNAWSYTSVLPVWLLGVARGKFLTYLITYAMEQSPSWEANRFSPCQEIPRILLNPKVHYRICKCMSLVPIVSKLPFIFSGAKCDKHLQSVCLRLDRSVGKYCDNGQRVVCSFLGAFAKLRKATVSFVMYVRPHETTRLPLDGFSSNLILEYFSKICRKNLSSIKIWREWRALYMKPSTHLW